MAKGKLVDFIKTLSYTFFANVVSLLVSTVCILIIPKIVGVESYGYYQLYTFYMSYVHILCLGWHDGIYLRLGGKHYDEINKPIYAMQFRLLAILECLAYTVIFGLSLLFSIEADKQTVIFFTCIGALSVCLRLMFIAITQATNRMKEYATVILSERVLFATLSLILVFCGFRSYKAIVAPDIIAKYISLGIGVWYCRDIVVSKPAPIRSTVPEIKENIFAGIKVMFALLSSSLILGVVRFGVEHHWGISTFGKVSLTLNISNMAVTAIGAIGTVIYPILRRTNQDKLPNTYKIIRTMLMGFTIGVLVFYYPMQRILTLWLPQYEESLRYAAILLPLCVYESKTSILVNTYFYTIRLESLQMKCNLTALALSIVLTGVSIYVFDSVTVAILSILIVLVFRCVLCETVLSTKLPIKIFKDVILELVMTISFIICNWYFGLLGMFMYAVCYIMYIIIKRKDILESLSFIKSMR